MKNMTLENVMKRIEEAFCLGGIGLWVSLALPIACMLLALGVAVFICLIPFMFIGRVALWVIDG